VRTRAAVAATAIAVLTLAACTAKSGDALDGGHTGSPTTDSPSDDAAVTETQSPDELLSAALTSAFLEGSVHVVSTSVHGRHRSVFDDYAALLDGTQDITVDAMHAYVRVTPDASYARGNAAARTRFFNLPPSVAKAVGDRWFEVRPGDHLYDEVTADVVLHEVLVDFPPLDHSELLGTHVVDGTPLIGIRGELTARGAHQRTVVATWWLESDGLHLPVRLVASAGKDRYVRAFSDWGEERVVRAPAGAVRLSRLWPAGGAAPAAATSLSPPPSTPRAA
jgi:hypothetical protein